MYEQIEWLTALAAFIVAYLISVVAIRRVLRKELADVLIEVRKRTAPIQAMSDSEDAIEATVTYLKSDHDRLDQMIRAQQVYLSIIDQRTQEIQQDSATLHKEITDRFAEYESARTEILAAYDTRTVGWIEVLTQHGITIPKELRPDNGVSDDDRP